MAVPTLQQVIDLTVNWFSRPGRPRLDVLRAELASMVTDPRMNVRARIVNIPPLTLQLQLVEHDVDGNVINTTTRSVTRDQLEERAEDFADIYDDASSTMRHRGEVP